VCLDLLICVYIHTNIHIWTHTYICACVCVCMYVGTNINTYTYINTHTYFVENYCLKSRYRPWFNIVSINIRFLVQYTNDIGPIISVHIGVNIIDIIDIYRMLKILIQKPLDDTKILNTALSLCVCVWEREREREWVSICVCMDVCLLVYVPIYP